MADQAALLAVVIKLLARTDGLFIPTRRWDRSDRWPGSVYRRRQRFPQHGLQNDDGGKASPSERQQRSRLLRALEDAGLVRRHDAGRGVALTEKGYDTGRALCYLPSYDEGLIILDRLYRLSQGLDQLEYRPGAVCEIALLNKPLKRWPKTTKVLYSLEDEILPLLVRGLADSDSTSQNSGAVGYWLTEPGIKLAVERTKEEAQAPPAIDLPEPAPGAMEIYNAECERTLRERTEWADDLHGDICGLLHCLPPLLTQREARKMDEQEAAREARRMEKEEAARANRRKA